LISPISSWPNSAADGMPKISNMRIQLLRLPQGR
jgi:hypothetical protein